jgi:hypothetical protein
MHQEASDNQMTPCIDIKSLYQIGITDEAS